MIGGLIGAPLAGHVLFLFGAASYLLAVGLIGYGLAKWFVPGYSLKDKAGCGCPDGAAGGMPLQSSHGCFKAGTKI